MLWGSLVLGLINTYVGLKGLNKLKKEPAPQFAETPEMAASRRRADEMAKSGFTPQEKAAYEQRLARSQNTAFQKSVDRAPNLSQQILSGINYTNIAAQNDMAMRDAELMRNNIRYADTFSKYLQELNNKNVANQIQQRDNAMKAYGQAAQSGMSQLGSFLNYNALKDLYGNGNPDAKVTGVGETTQTPFFTGKNANMMQPSMETDYDFTKDIESIFQNKPPYEPK